MGNHKLSRKYKGCTDWMSNEEWYRIDEERNRYVLTNKAPEEARRSFELWEKINVIHCEKEILKCK